jgi:diguanylate cyclase
MSFNKDDFPSPNTVPVEDLPAFGVTLPASAAQAARILQTLVFSSSSHLAFVKRDLTWGYVNPSAAKSLGKRVEDLIGRPLGESIVNDHPRPLEQTITKVFQTGNATECDSLIKNFDSDTPRWMRIAVIPHRDAKGEIAGAVVRARDIHDEVVARTTAQMQHELIQRHLNTGQLAFVQMDDLLRVERWSNAAASIFGWSSEEALGRKPKDLFPTHPDDFDLVRNAIRDMRNDASNERVHVRCRSYTKDGSLIWCDWYASVLQVPGAAAPSVLCFAVDVTESVAAKEALRRAARIDPLTMLPNRYAFYEWLGEHLEKVDTKGHVIFVDLDGFKEVNDRYGHQTGDQVLCNVATRLKNVIGEQDFCARYGGDEFALFIFDAQNALRVSMIAEKIVSELRRPFDVGVLNIELSCSVGIAQARPRAQNAQMLVTHADLAMYQAKANGRDQIAMYTDALGERERTRVQLQTGLRDALRNGQIYADFQPRVDVNSLKIVGAEALARWKSPDGSMVNPADFVAVAEETGLIHDLGAVVLQRACEFARQMNASRQEVNNPFVVSVNLSTLQLRQPEFVKRAKSIFASAGCMPHWIEFEVTESSELTDTTCMERLNDLVKGFGARCALDDFGTGYSNLVELTNLPLSVMKIDRSIIKKLTADNTSLVAAVLGLAKSLRLSVVAEGVETEKQLLQLRALGCEQFQGFLFSPAISSDELSARLHAQANLS